MKKPEREGKRCHRHLESHIVPTQPAGRWGCSWGRLTHRPLDLLCNRYKEDPLWNLAEHTGKDQSPFLICFIQLLRVDKGGIK